MNCRQNQPGFTLIELLVVVAILAIVLTVGMSTMEYLLPESRLTVAARDIAAFLADARDDAIINGKTVRVEFDLGRANKSKQAYRSYRDPDPGEEDDFEELEFMLTLREWDSPPDGVQIDALHLGEDEIIQEGSYTFAAYPDGTMTPFTLHLYSAEIDAWYSVQVSGLIAEASVVEGQAEHYFLTEDSF